MIQGVREVFDIVDLKQDRDGEGEGNSLQQQNPQRLRRNKSVNENGNENGKIVLIGRGVADLPIEQSLEFALDYHTI